MKAVVALLILVVLTYRLIFPWASPLLDFVGIFVSVVLVLISLAMRPAKSAASEDNVTHEDGSESER